MSTDHSPARTVPSPPMPIRRPRIRAGPLRRSRLVLCSLALYTALLSPGCRDSPSQESLDQAWKRADQAAARVAEAEQHVRHVDRLRDIDRLRGQAEGVELREQIATLRGVTIGLALVVLALTLWLVIEVRRRRVAIAILESITPPDEPARSPDPGGA